MRKDVDRLEVITERFSKIGSSPDLTSEKLYHTLRATVLYLRPRLPGRVQIEVIPPADPDMQVPLNRALFSWVFENLIRNAIDAMEGEGSIELEIIPEGNQVHVDVTDSGKGIPRLPTSNCFPTRLHHQETWLGARALAQQTHHRAVSRREDLREAQCSGERDHVPDHVE